MTKALLRRAAQHLRKADPFLHTLINRVGPCRLQVERGSFFAKLVEAICYQQLTGKAAATIHKRLLALLGRRVPRPEDILRATDAELRGVGLSRPKLSYLRDLSQKVRGGLPLHRLSRLDDEAVVATLTEVKGIGRWTAEMFLIFTLGRPDVLAVDDYGIRKAMQRAYRKRTLPQGEWMCRKAEPWRPYRTVACWYLWRSLDPPN